MSSVLHRRSQNFELRLRRRRSADDAVGSVGRMPAPPATPATPSASAVTSAMPNTSMASFSLLFVNEETERVYRSEQMQLVFTKTMFLGGLFGLFNLLFLGPHIDFQGNPLVFVAKVLRIVGPMCVSLLLYFGVLRFPGGVHHRMATAVFEVAVTLQVVSDCWSHAWYAGILGQTLPVSTLFVICSTCLTGFPWLYHCFMGVFPIMLFVASNYFCSDEPLDIDGIVNAVLIAPGMVLIGFVFVAAILAVVSRLDNETMAGPPLAGKSEEPEQLSDLPMEKKDGAVSSEPQQQIRFEHMLDSLSGDQESVNLLLQVFVQDHYDDVEALRSLINVDPDSAMRKAHSLKGVASNLGADILRDAALIAETKLKQGERLTREELDHLAESLRRAIGEAQSYIAAHKATGGGGYLHSE